MSKKLGFIFFLLIGCSHTVKAPQKPVAAQASVVAREFSQGEVILATQYLTKIFDKEMQPSACVPNNDEASLLLRTIRPRMEVIEDDIEATFDDAKAVQKHLDECKKNCTCLYIDDLLREHLVPLTKKQRASLNDKRSPAELNRCFSYIQSTFCDSDLYKQLDAEKVDFSFSEEDP
jgi:hypothetical protein